jgi:DNA repair exonuclease SbcCD ATPase subunit
MATKGSTIPERIARWKVIAAALKPLLAEMPHLTELHSQLEAIIARSEELDARIEALKAESQEVNRTREELATTGDDVRNRLGAALRTIHGFRSEKLIEFGLKPRRTRGRDRKPRAKKPKPGTEPASVAAPQNQL